MTPHFRSLTAVALLAAQFLAGCTSWQVVDVSPRALVDSAHVTKLQVWQKGGGMFVIDAPAISGDSLMWLSKGHSRTLPQTARQAKWRIKWLACVASHWRRSITWRSARSAASRLSS